MGARVVAQPCQDEAGGHTVFVVEPKGRSVFSDVPLAFEPGVLLADTQAEATCTRFEFHNPRQAGFASTS